MTAPYSSSRFAFEGTETTETSIVRAGGSEDPSGQAQSRKIVTTANAQWLRPFRCAPWAIWNETTGADVTVTVYGTALSASMPTNEDVFMEVEYLSDVSSTLGKIVSTTKANVLATSAAVASDSSTWAATSVGDPYWYNVAFLCGYEGVNGATSGPAFTDESPTAVGIGTVSGAHAISTAQFKFGASSLTASGAGSVFYGSPSSFDLGSAPFTIEAWIRPNAVVTGVLQFIAAKWGTTGSINWVLYIDTTGVLAFKVSTTGSDVVVLLGGALTANAWQHVCADFDGTKYRLYVNGVMSASSTTLLTIYYSTVPAFSVGANSINANVLAGWIDEVRLTRGVGRYASDAGFSVPTAAFPRTPLWWPFKLVATLNSPQPGRPGLIHVRPKIGKPSATVYLDPQIELTPASAAPSAVHKSSRYAYEGTETTETSIVRSGGTAHSRKIVTTANSQWLRPYRAEPYAIWNDTVGADVTVTVYGLSYGDTLPTNCDIWLECEYLGNSSSTLGSIATTTRSNVLATCTTLALDSSEWSEPPGDPYFSSVNMLFGFEGEDGATTGPGFINERPVAGQALTIGVAARISTAQFRFGSSSLFPNNTVGTQGVWYLDHEDWELANIPFTIECWIYPTVVAGTKTIIGKWYMSTGRSWELDIINSVLTWRTSTDGANIFIDVSGGTIAVNTWRAVCVEWDGVKQRLYLDGVMIASSTTSRTLYNSVIAETRIGGNSLASTWFDGWIDELRFTKGVARYASDSGYTVETVPFPRIGLHTPFKLVATLSSPQPGQPGLINVRVRAAKPSSTFYIDPVPVLS